MTSSIRPMNWEPMSKMSKYLCVRIGLTQHWFNFMFRSYTMCHRFPPMRIHLCYQKYLLINKSDMDQVDLFTLFVIIFHQMQ